MSETTPLKKTTKPEENIMSTKHIISIEDDTYTITADWAQASSPVMIDDEDGEPTSTPFQVADFGHRPEAMIPELIEWLSSQAGENLDPENVATIREA